MADEAVTTADRGLRVLAADEDRAALQTTATVLEGLGHDVTSLAVHVSEAAAHIVAEEPDLAVVVVHQDDEHALVAHRGDQRVRLRPRHRACCTARTRSSSATPPSAASTRTRGSRRRRRSRARSRSRWPPRRGHGALRQVDQLEGALDRRAIIERAKGILMERHGITEQAAFDKLRTAARASNRRVVDLARAVADTRALLPKEPGAAPADD